MKRFLVLAMVLIFFVGGIETTLAEIVPATDPASQVDGAVLDKYMPKPTNWSSLSAEQKRNFRQSQITFLVTEIIPQLEKKGTETAPVEGVDYFGDAHQRIMANEAQEAGFTKQQALDLVIKAVSEKRTLKGRGPEALSNFYFALDKKREEMKLAEKPASVVDWNKVGAQEAIRAWMEANGPVLFKAYLETNGYNGYVKKEDLATLKTDLANLSSRVGEVAIIADTNKLDLIQLQQTYVWVEVDGVEGRTTQVPVSIQQDMVPEALAKDIAALKANTPKGVDGKTLIPMASKADLDKTNERIEKAEKKVDGLVRAVLAVGLKDRDKALIELYAVFSQGDNVKGFEDHLVKIGRQGDFDKIKKAAERAAGERCIKLTP